MPRLPQCLYAESGEYNYGRRFCISENTEVNSGKCTDLSALTLKHACKLTFDAECHELPVQCRVFVVRSREPRSSSTTDISNGSYSTVTDADLTVVGIRPLTLLSPNAVTALVLPKAAASLTLDCTPTGLRIEYRSQGYCQIEDAGEYATLR